MLQLRIEDTTSTRTFATDRPEILVGRRADVDLVIGDAAASRTHCMLRVKDGELAVIDLGTVNGTKVDGKRIEQVALKPGQAFAIGKTVFRIAQCGNVKAALPPPRPRLERSPRPRQAFPAPVPTGGPAPDFGREIRNLVRRTPWYTASLVIHALALLLMGLVPFERLNRDETLRLEAVEPRAGEELESFEDPELDAEEPLFGSIPEDEIVAPEDEPPQATTDEPPPVPEPNVFDSPTISPSPGMRIQKLDKPLPVFSKKLKVDDKKINTTNLEKEHDAAADAVLRGLGGRRLPTGIDAKRIVVVNGEFDEMETVLERYRIPHTVITRKDLVRKRLAGARILCVNCGRDPSPADASKVAERVQRFVRRGGWLITSDWALRPYLTEAFPDRIEHVPTGGHQRDTTVTVEPIRSSPLLVGAFDRARKSRWWLEESSRFFRVKPGKATVLVRSAEMKRRYGHEAVVVEFLEGRGRVLHLLGHFYQKDGNRLGVAGMHRLVLNYILERFPLTGRKRDRDRGRGRDG